MRLMTRVLVTGGLGFIGSHVVDAFADAGHEVVVVDNLDPAAHAGEPDYRRDDVTYHRLAVEALDDHAELVAGIDLVSHQAGKVGLGVDFSDVTAYVRSNDLGTAALLRALHHTRFRGRLGLASSMVVYGEGAYRCATH